MKETIAFILLTLLTLDFRDEIFECSHQVLDQLLANSSSNQDSDFVRKPQLERQLRTSILFAEAKGVAGLGKAGGDNQGGSDKGGQQVPPEVYIALTYAGSAFLLTLSVPLILYSLNKLLNKIEDCFGCGPKSKLEKRTKKKLESKSIVTVSRQVVDNGIVLENNVKQAKNINLQLDRNLDQQFHQHHMQQQYSKYHQLPAFSSLVGNGGYNSDGARDLMLGSSTNDKQSCSPANSNTNDFPCDPDASYKAVTSKKHQQSFHIYHPEQSNPNVI